MTAPRAEPGITVEGVWKKFRRGERHDSLRDLLPSLARRFARGRGDPAELEARDFWALRDVNLEIRPGQALGIIGHNGAGKSTLLKLITRIMRPTLGRCAVRGRIGALIELAAGFHPDLTGRENVFLQGAIMGMPAAVIRNRFDEIVEFAGVADFIDTPVKRYSSGMNARLGFAIAAHLEPEVLIIDEVLSVGDMAFQERAFGRMREIARSGIPVAVVSHQLDRITALSTHAILLRRGVVVAMGTPTDCITQYVTGELGQAEGTSTVVPGLSLTGLAPETPGPVRSGERRTIILRGRYEPDQAGSQRLGFMVRVRRMDTGQVVFTTSTHRHGLHLTAPGPFGVNFDLQFNVGEGVLSVETGIIDADTEHHLGEGPWTHMEVVPGLPFQGVAQLNSMVTIDFDS